MKSVTPEGKNLEQAVDKADLARRFNRTAGDG